jgi:glucose-1-phosphate cytidylyltransferase
MKAVILVGGWIKAGFMVMEPAVFNSIDGDETVLEREPMRRLSADGELGVYKHSGYWQCMDAAREKGAVEALLDVNSPWRRAPLDGVEGMNSNFGCRAPP